MKFKGLGRIILAQAAVSVFSQHAGFSGLMTWYGMSVFIALTVVTFTGLEQLINCNRKGNR